MKTKNTSISVLFLAGCITGLVLVGLVLVFLIGSQLSLFDLRIGNSVNCRLFVNVLPAGSMVVMDGKQVGLTPLVLLTKPGNHNLRVEKENYNTFQTKINIKSNEVVIVEYKLLHQPVITNVSFNAMMPLWSDRDHLIFVSLDDGKLYQYSSSGLNFLIEEPLDDVFGVSIAPQGDLLSIMENKGDFLNISNLSLKDGSFKSIGFGGTLPVWGPDDQTFYFLGWNGADAVGTPEGFHLWSGRRDDTLDAVDFPQIENTYGADSTAWSSDGQYFITISDSLVDIWEFDGTTFIYLKRLEPSFGAVWAPLGIQLAYLQGNSIYTISELDKSLSPNLLTRNATFPLQWMPDGNHIVFTTFDPVESGSAFWSVDVQTGVRTLMADSSLILGRVTDFAISPDGARIAYTNDLDHLNILFIGK